MSLAPPFTCSVSDARRMRWALLATALALVPAGCEMLQPTSESPPGPGLKNQLPPVLQRMRDTYEDLASGRFISLADFETPGQEMLFRCVGPDGTEGRRPQPTLSILRSRNETGGMGLKVRLADPTDQLVCDGKRSQERVLVRDWHSYALLLMSLYGPPQGALLEFTLQSGQQTPLRWVRTVHVGPGWNLIRLDLATAGDWINLADVRALVWRAPQLTAPLDLYVDDIIIADNAQHILGEQAGPGELYVLSRGRRICVGTRERFELSFADGQIVAWRSGDDDNLVDPDGLGPWPLPLAGDWYSAPSPSIAYDDPQLFADWGTSVATAQRIVEATPFRVVVAGQWRFVGGAQSLATSPAQPDMPGHTWQYVIYPSGAVYVSVQSGAPATGWHGPRVGYALAIDGRRGFHRIDPAPGEASTGFVLLARAGSQRADLLWSWPRAAQFPHRHELASPDERRVAVIVGDVATSPVVHTAHMFRLWPPDIEAAPEANSFAADYQNPAPLGLTTGKRLTDAPGDLDHDGYSEAEGTYELVLDGSVLRFDFAPGPLLRYDAVFRVHETAGRRCWVYARGRLVTDVGRDADDNLLFRLGHVASAPVGVEVHTTTPDAAP